MANVQDKKLVFRLAGIGFSVDISQVAEVIDLRGEQLLPPGDASAVGGLMGCLDRQGRMLDVFDGRQLFGLAPREDRRRLTVLVITAHPQWYGWAVDTIAGIFPGRDFERCKPPACSAFSYCSCWELLVWRGEPLVNCTGRLDLSGG